MNKKKNNKLLFLFLAFVFVIGAVFIYQPLWGKISSFRPWSFGLDIAGGSVLTYEIDFSQVSESDRDFVAEGLRDVIERRINFSGVREPRVYLDKSDSATRLHVELAGIKDVNEAIREIGETPLLDFREVVQVQGEDSTSTVSIDFVKTELTGRYIKSAQLAFDQVSGQPYVSLEFNDEGSKIFEFLTQKNIGKPLAIFLDDEPIEIPEVREKITGGKAQISGGFTVDSARELVQRFNAGALPAPIILVNQTTISPDLGADSLDEAFRGGLFGTLLIFLFMLVFYRRLGLFSVAALIIYIVLVLAVFKLVPVTLTLSGIAGFILSIGMAIDANILIFERTKEELSRGLSALAAEEEGFKRAWTSIRDSNISTIITALVLFYFTSGFVKGFALTLFIGVLVSMFSAITVTRTLLRVFTKAGEIKK